jgi:DNA-binding NarL/FixJ family response regulator
LGLGKPLTNSPIRALVVDDYEPFRRFVRSTLQKLAEVQVIGEASDGLQAVQQAQQLQPDLIVLDIGLPTLNGIEAARQIRTLSPSSKVLLLTENRSSEIVEEGIRAGVSGYVVKSDAAHELLLAIEAVLHGKQFPSIGLKDRTSVDIADSAARREKVTAASTLQSPAPREDILD